MHLGAGRVPLSPFRYSWLCPLMRSFLLSRCRSGHAVVSCVVGATRSARKDVVLGEAFRGRAVARRGASPIVRKCSRGLVGFGSVEVASWRFHPTMWHDLANGMSLSKLCCRWITLNESRLAQRMRRDQTLPFACLPLAMQGVVRSVASSLANVRACER